MSALPHGLSPSSRVVVRAVDRLWTEAQTCVRYGWTEQRFRWTEEPSHPKWKYLSRLKEIGDEPLAGPLRRLGETYHGMPMGSFVKACEKHDFLIDSFPVSINPGGHVPVLVRERDGGIIVGYAHDGSMRSAAFFLPHGNREIGFATECHDCLDAFGMLMDIHDHGGDGYPLKWDNASRDRMHAMALLCPVAEFKMSSLADLSHEAGRLYIEDVCQTRIGSLPTPWRGMFSRILMPRPARLRKP